MLHYASHFMKSGQFVAVLHTERCQFVKKIPQNINK